MVIREKSVVQKRVYGVDPQIGYLLVSYPRSKEEWSPDVICELLDELNNEPILSSFRI